MSTATLTRAFICVSPMAWPHPWTANPNLKGRAPGECGMEFDSQFDRLVHMYEAHPAYIADLQKGYLWRSIFDGQEAATLALLPSDVPEQFEFGDPEPESRPSGPAGGHADYSPSERQLAFIASLATQKGVEVPVVETKDEASEAIARLQLLPDVDSIRRNKFDAPCSTCRGMVPAGEGALTKDGATGRWLVGHLSCPDVPDNSTPEIPDGSYCVTAEAGNYSFYGVKAGRNPGVVFVDQLLGGGPNGTFQRQSVPHGQRTAILAKIAADVEGAGLLFAREAKCCRRCNRGLSNSTSTARGYGKDCADIVGV